MTEVSLNLEICDENVECINPMDRKNEIIVKRTWQNPIYTIDLFLFKRPKFSEL